MSDERLRHLERAWYEQKNEHTARPYLQECIRAGRYSRNEVSMAYRLVTHDEILRKIQYALISLANFDVSRANMANSYMGSVTPLRRPIDEGFNDERTRNYSLNPTCAVLLYLERSAADLENVILNPTHENHTLVADLEEMSRRMTEAMGIPKSMLDTP